MQHCATVCNAQEKVMFSMFGCQYIKTEYSTTSLENVITKMEYEYTNDIEENEKHHI